MLAHHLLVHVVSILAAGRPTPAVPSPTPAVPSPTSVVPNPVPVSPVSSSGIDLLLGYAKWGALTACGASALISGGMLAMGHLSSRPDLAERGTKALLWSLLGAAVVALAIPTLNTIFGSVGP
jgi:hypothetical protein